MLRTWHNDSFISGPPGALQGPSDQSGPFLALGLALSVALNALLCAHTPLYWQELLIEGQTHICTRIQEHYVCIDTFKGTCMHADITPIMNMHTYISMVIIMCKQRPFSIHPHRHAHKET